MGKGKKKGGKEEKKEEPKPEDLPLSSLSVSEGQASTSRETSAPPEDDGGLTGGGRKKRQKNKGGSDAGLQTAAPAETTPVEEKPKTVEEKPKPMEEKPKPVEEEDEGGLGLDLGGAKKRRPRKKKEAAAGAVSAPPAGSVPQTTPVLGDPVPAKTGAPAPWGQRPSQTAPILGPPGFQPQTGYPAHPPPALPAQPGYPGLSQVPPGYTEPGSSSRGRGRGKPADGAQRGQPAFGQPQFPEPQFPQPQPKMGSQVEVPAARAQSSETTLCRFKVPHKIVGNSVRARPVNVLTNYLPMTIKPLKIHRYDVTFKPDKPKKMIPRIFKLAQDKLFRQSTIAFDQMKNCYSLHKLPRVTQYDRVSINVEIVDNNGKTMEFEVSFKETGVVDFGTILDYMSKGGTSLNPPTEAIQCIDVILRQGTLENYIKAGRQFFKRPSRPVDLGDGLEMWTGLFQSAIFTSQPFINIDVAHKGFPKQQPLVDALVHEFRLDVNQPVESQRSRGVENFLSFLKGLRVMATIGGDSSAKGHRREFICNELVAPPNQITFIMNDADGRGTKMTVADYFAKEKRVRLRYPNLNCVWVGPRDKKIYYPMELLEVSYGQAVNKQLNEMQLSKMVREAATPPDERKRKIEEVMRDMNYERNAYFKQFGLDIKNEFFPVQAKILQPPRLEVGDGQQIEPRRGAWQANKLLKAEALESWGFLALDLDYNNSNAHQIITQVMNVGSRMGMRVSEPKQNQQFYNVRIQDLHNVLFRALQAEVKFLFIIVATRGRDYYHRVKKMAERDVGILTQCIKEYTAKNRMNESTIRNILLKVNSKLMGINQALDGRSMPKCLAGGGVMVVGADVTHPSPEQSSVPSIAAVTASLDAKFFIYNIQLSVQTPKKEMIVEFEDMMVEHLQTYKKYQKGALPRKIFVFRDGVSEGQFAQVMNSELQAVHNAYQRMAGPNAKPEVLFLLVQKRHHTRLFVPNSPQNVEPGTVVDTHIVHARELDFYLVSHQAIKGTARPTRYHAVCNDGGIPHDEVEQLTFYLCHLYSRCMRSVSYPTPTYYAHLACLRARSLTHGEKFNNAELERKPQRLRVMDKILEASRMFFV